MKIQENIRKVLREEVSLMDKIKGFFSKKNNTTNKEGRLVNLIVNYINLTFEITEDKSPYVGKVNKYIYFEPDGRIVMRYIPQYKRLEYINDFTKEIYNTIPDERLLEEDSELMGKVYEKLTNRKVEKSQNFSFFLWT